MAATEIHDDDRAKYTVKNLPVSSYTDHGKPCQENFGYFWTGTRRISRFQYIDEYGQKFNESEFTQTTFLSKEFFDFNTKLFPIICQIFDRKSSERKVVAENKCKGFSYFKYFSRQIKL